MRNSAVKKMATATTCAPTELKLARSPSASKAPSTPPGGIAPRTSGKFHSASSDGTERIIIAYPIGVATGESSGWLRNQRTPSAKIPMGSRNAA